MKANIINPSLVRIKVNLVNVIGPASTLHVGLICCVESSKRERHYTQGSIGRSHPNIV
jgi:hypothetical protein